MRSFILIIFLFLADYLTAQHVTFSWAKQLKGTLRVDLQDMTCDKDGNVYCCGWFDDTVDLDPGPAVYKLTCRGYEDGFICKYDSSGNLVWARQMSGPMGHEPRSIAVDLWGNIYVAGNFDDSTILSDGTAPATLISAQGSSGFVLKLANDGSLVWIQQIGINQYLLPTEITTDQAGDIITGGIFTGTIDFDPSISVYNLSSSGDRNNFMFKLDSYGNFQWAAVAGKSYQGYPLISIATDETNNVYATGVFADSADFDPGPGTYELYSKGYSDIFFVKLDPHGYFRWAGSIGGSHVDILQNIVVSNNNIYFCGGFGDTLDFDPGPGTYITSPVNGSDIYVCSLDTAGNFKWIRQMGNGRESFARLITTDKSGNIYFSGYFIGGMDMDPGPCIYEIKSYPITEPDIYDLFVSSLDSSGNFRWARNIMSGPDIKYLSSVAVDSTGNVYTAGSFFRTADFDPSETEYNLTSNGLYDSYISKLGICNNSTTAELFVDTCGPYTINCVTYHTTGTYTIILENTKGCDSIITLHLQMIPSGITANDTIIACNMYLWNGNSYHNSGTYIDTLQAISGCDSIVTLHLTIIPPVFSTIDTSICAGQSFAGHSSSGTYIDTLRAANGCDSIRTTHLVIIPPLRSSIDTSICAGQNFAGYHSSGIYIDTLQTMNGCDSIRTIHLLVIPPAVSSIDTSICTGQSFAGYNSSGTYIDTLQAANGCDSIRTIHLTVKELPQPDLGPDQIICPGDSIILNPGIFDNYLWQDGNTNSTYTVKHPGSYIVNVSDHCGNASDNILVTTSICDFRFPSVFTPNNDGLNDMFRSLGHAVVNEFSLTVYDRWGKTIFSTNDPAKGWDGSYKGTTLSNGVYAWYCRYSKNGVSHELKGTVMLMR